MTITVIQLPRTLEMLIESRLDTIDRMLVGRVPRPDRLAIVKEVESQIYDLLQEGGQEEHSRESVLAALARLDPPEAYLPDESTSEPGRSTVPVSPRSRLNPQPAERRQHAGRASGILGLIAVFLLLLIPIPYLVGLLLQNEFVMLFGWGAEILAILTVGILGIVFGIYSGFKGAWPIVGVVASALSTLMVFLASALLLALVLGGGL